MDHKADLLDKSKRYCELAGISPARLATLVVNDGKFFRRIEGGGAFTTRTYERFMTFFAEHQPFLESATNAPVPHGGHELPNQPGEAAHAEDRV